MIQEKITEILISDALRKILNEIKDDSVIASLLLKGTYTKEEIVDFPVNYISVSSEDRTKISYLTKERIDGFVNSQLPEDLYWSSSRRFQAKPGSFLSKLFKNIQPKDVEKFSNLFKSIADRPSFTFEVVKGEEIRKNYNYKVYANDRGTLGASCMKHEECQKYLGIYTENRDIISMLVMKNDDNLVIGRALLWDFESYKIMDRIYTINDESLSFYFKQWATKNNYLYKSEQNWSNSLSFSQLNSGDQKKQELNLGVKLKRADFSHYPYMDTFKFIDIKGEMIYNYIPENVYIKTLCAADGSRYESDYLKLDDIDRVFRVRGDCTFVIYKNLTTWCNNTQWSNVNDQPILNGDHIYDESIGDYIFNLELDHLNNKDRIEEVRRAREERRKISESKKFKSEIAMPAVDGLTARLYQHILSEVSLDDISENYSESDSEDWGEEAPVPEERMEENTPEDNRPEYIGIVS